VQVALPNALDLRQQQQRVALGPDTAAVRFACKGGVPIDAGGEMEITVLWGSTLILRGRIAASTAVASVQGFSCEVN
jgi:hypothetical protein